MRMQPRYKLKALVLIATLAGMPSVFSQTINADLAPSYQFLVSDRADANGVLYTATAGALKGLRLPLSFVDSAEYWGEFVCKQPGNSCAVTDIYDPKSSTLTPQKSIAGDLQTERVNTHNGANIYDAATWQIAVMLGSVINKFSISKESNKNALDAYSLVSNQNSLLKESYSGNAARAVSGLNRAVTNGNVFLYNHKAIDDISRAYTFRTVGRSWLSVDPFTNTKYASLIKADNLPATNSDYQIGKVSWTDWKPISGENAWAFLIGPLQAAHIHFIIGQKNTFVPFDDLAVQNALAILPTFVAMQSQLGAIYYAPAGTVKNQGDELVNPYEVAVENSFSLYAGLNILRGTLTSELVHQKNLSAADRATISRALKVLATMIDGGQFEDRRTTAGLLAFFKNSAWRDGEFVQGGLANDPSQKNTWRPTLQPKAVDVNTWGIAALGAKKIDQWFGFGATFNNWQKVKGWGGYGFGKELWGVGFSNQDGNGISADGNYRQGIMSAEWSAGAIVAVRNMIAYYESAPHESPNNTNAQRYLESLKKDEGSMLDALQNLRIDNYKVSSVAGKPEKYTTLLNTKTLPYVYASKRYMIPFGWYANPIPSTCSTAWVIMLANGFDPLGYGGTTN